MLSKTRPDRQLPDGPRAAQEQLRHHLDALRGNEDYLRTLVLRQAEHSGRTLLKDSGRRRLLSIKTADNLAALLLRASQLESDFGLPTGALSRPVSVFQERLVELVDTWILFRPNASKWSQNHPSLWALLQESQGHFELQAFEDGFHRIERFAEGPEPSEKGAELEAARLFRDLVDHPLNERMRRCRRCREFFIAGRSDQLACSSRCATALTARNANKRRREKDRNRRLARLRTAINRIAPRKGVPADWKKRVAKQASLTLTFVTRALTRGEIETPGTRKKAKRGTSPLS
jgi:hypothetical protein